MKKLKMNKGITLIALVVTIVVLLILASISIATLTGDSGLIQKSKMAKENAEIEDEKKMISVAVAEAMGKNRNGDLTYSDFKEKLDKVIKKEAQRDYELTPNEDSIKYLITFTDTKRIYQVDGTGTVAKLDKAPVDEDLVSYSIQIVVNITEYNKTLGEYPVVFGVLGTKEGNIVYDDVVSGVISKVGKNTISVDVLVPKDTSLTVTEKYSGACYNIDSDASLQKNLTDTSNATQYEFTNSYNYKKLNTNENTTELQKNTYDKLEVKN